MTIMILLGWDAEIWGRFGCRVVSETFGTTKRDKGRRSIYLFNPILNFCTVEVKVHVHIERGIAITKLATKSNCVGEAETGNTLQVNNVIEK